MRWHVAVREARLHELFSGWSWGDCTGSTRMVGIVLLLPSPPMWLLLSFLSVSMVRHTLVSKDWPSLLSDK